MAEETGSCTFCEIVARRAPVRLCHEDEDVLVFLPLQQMTEGHVLVVPKDHYDGALDCPTPTFERIMGVARDVAARLVAYLGMDSVNIIQSTGGAAFQTVFHLHVHVLPRRVDDGFSFSARRLIRSDVELDRVHAELRAALHVK